MPNVSDPRADTTSDAVAVAFVVTDPQRYAADAEALVAASDGDVEVTGVSRASGATLDGVDCVVTDSADVSLPPDAPPVVLFADAPPESAASVAGYVRRHADANDSLALADQIRLVVARNAPTDAPLDGDVAVSYGGIVETMEDGAFVVDADGVLVYVNAAIESAFEIDRETYVGRHLGALVDDGVISEDAVGRLRTAVADVGRGDRPTRTLEFEVPRATEPLTVEVRLAPLGQGDVVVGSVRNVTARDRIEGRLRENHEKIERLHDIATDLGTARSDDEVYDLAVEAAASILEFDICAVDAVVDDHFVPKAVSDSEDVSTHDSVHVEDASIAGRTYREGRTVLVDDLRPVAEADPADDQYRSMLSVPLGDRGVFQAASREPGAFDENDRDLAELLVAHITEALERLQAEAELRAERETIAELHGAATDIVAARDEETLARHVIEAAERILDFDVSSVVLHDGDWLVPVATTTKLPEGGARRMRTDEGLAGKTFQSGQSHVVTDVERDDDAKPAHETYRSGVSVPVGDHGVFQAIATEPAAFDESDVELAELLMSHASASLSRLRVEKALRDRRKKIERLHESTADIVAARSEQELFDLTVEAAESVLELEVCVVCVEADDRDGLEVVATSESDIAPELGEYVPPGEGIVGWTYASGESDLTTDVQAAETAAPSDEQYRSALSIPVGDVGVFQAISTDVAAYDRNDLGLAELLVSHVAETLARTRLEGDLVAERDRFRALFENVPDPVAAFEFVDGDPLVRDLNGPFQETFGYDVDELRGENIDEYIVPTDREEEAATLNQQLSAGESLNTTGRRKTADGVRDFLLHVVPLQVGERSLQGYAIYTDITDQKRRQRDLERQNARLDQFASIVSHDLRNPLNVAQGHLELAREVGEETYFERAADAHDQMSRMIDELLTLARHGDIVGETRPVDLHDVARRAWAIVDTRSATLDVAGDLVFPADVERLSELLQNLYRNAIEHAGQDVTVTVGPCEAGFYVADDGPGIPASARETVFESGYTTASTGTGFGLTIVQQIAEAHGWSVAVEEGTDGGARFVFTVPEGAPGPD